VFKIGQNGSTAINFACSRKSSWLADLPFDEDSFGEGDVFGFDLGGGAIEDIRMRAQNRFFDHLYRVWTHRLLRIRESQRCHLKALARRWNDRV